MVAEVIINSTAKKLNRIFDYNIPQELEELIFVGSKVLVPFGNMKTLEEDVDRFYKKIDDNDLEVVSYTLNVSYEDYINDIVLKLKE